MHPRPAVRGAGALVATALLLSACQDGPDADGHGGSAGQPADATEEALEGDAPGPTDEATDEPSLAFGEPVALGHGVVVGSTPDGSGIWATAPEPRSDQMGCEGVPFEFLHVVDPADGNRRRALPDVADEDQPFVTHLRVNPAAPEQVLLLSGCEGFLGRIDVGSLAPDGTITDLVEVSPPPAELATASVRWNGPSTLTAVGVEAYGTPGLWLHDLDTGEWMDLDPTPYVDWVPLADGLAVEVLFEQARIVDADGVVVDALVANQVVPFAGGFPLLASAWGQGADAGRTVLVERVGEQRVLDEFGGFGMGFSPDGRHAVWSTTDPAGDDTATTILDLQDGDEVVVPGVWFAGVAWLADGIAFTSEGPADASGFGTPTVTWLPFA